MFEAGQRVRYTGKSKKYNTPSAIGELGTISDRPISKVSVNVVWDNPVLNGIIGSWGVYPENIEVIEYHYHSDQSGDTEDDI